MVSQVVSFREALARRGDYSRGDWTRDRVYALSEKTVTILRALNRPVSVTVFLHPSRDTEEARALGNLIRELSDRFHRYAPDNFQVQFIDPDRAPEHTEALQKKYAISAYDLSEGVVIFTSGTPGVASMPGSGFVRMMFAGLMSRCTTPCSAACLSPAAIWRAMAQARCSSIGPWRSIRSCNVSPSRSSMAR